MGKIWSEADIRKELKRLDRKTGLKGATLPISFGKGKSVLGTFCSTDGGAFRFSRYYFDDPSWPEEEAYDTIRHEYAHYMDHELYGNMGHGITWKKCCMEIGALPVRCYSSERAKYHQDKHKMEREKSMRLDQYKVGHFIVHPKYGKGEIIEIDGLDMSRYAVVLFPDMMRKKLSLLWVAENC